MMDAWINVFYSMVNRIGFSDPMHAALVHMPMGLLVGAFIFNLLAALSVSWKRLAVSSHHCMVLAFLFLFLVLPSGLMDWRHFYASAWLPPARRSTNQRAFSFGSPPARLPSGADVSPASAGPTRSSCGGRTGWPIIL